MNAAFLSHLISQQGVHHSVSSRVHLGVKGIRGDDQSRIGSVVSCLERENEFSCEGSNWY